MQTVKRVLVICYYWPPAGGSGVQRWVKFAKYLPAEGWQPVVYTPENPEYTAIDRTLGEEIPPEAEIIKTHIWEPYSAYRRIFGKGASTDMKTLTAGEGDKTDKTTTQAGATGGEVTPISSGKKSWKQRLSLWIRGNMFIPDPRVKWVRPSVRFLKKYLAEHPVDVIVTTGPPHSVHLIGKRLHEALGTPWVADFRDPWSRMYYLKHLGMTKRSWRKLKTMEQSVLDSCSTVLAVTPAVQADFRAMTSTPVECITNGFDDADFKEISRLRPSGSARNDKNATAGIQGTADAKGTTGAQGAASTQGTTERFTIVHTGLLATDGNPTELWRVLGDMTKTDETFRDKLEIRLVGKTDAEVLRSMEEAGIKANVTNLGYLDHLSSVAEQQGADVLILPLRNDPEYKPILPGKLFEYLASRRPVIGIGQPDGAMADVLRETGAGETYDWGDRDGIRSAIESLWGEYLRGGIPARDGNIEKYSRKSLTRELAGLLDRMAAQKPQA